jgi:DNA-binding winged helix-turn-helix (wHTH) protein
VLQVFRYGASIDIFAQQKGVYVFGPCRLDLVRRSVLCGGAPVKLGASLSETLFYLVENHDPLVERDELQQAVWHGRSVDGVG